MSIHNTWFVPRPKRQLNVATLFDSLVAFNDVAVGKKWDRTVQLAFEDELKKRGVKKTGTLRSRAAGEGGGGARTYYSMFKQLGLVFKESVSKTEQLTWAGEDLLKGNQPFVDIMKEQIIRYQYPSNSSYKNAGAVDKRFTVHPFWFLLKLLSDGRIANYLTILEIKKIVIINAVNDMDSCVTNVVNQILAYRAGGDAALGYTLVSYGCLRFKPGKETKDSFYDIANTIVNYLDCTQLIVRSGDQLRISPLKAAEVATIVSTTPKFIKNYDIHENYQRSYGIGVRKKDTRTFAGGISSTARSIKESRISQEFISESIKTPITSITAPLVKSIADKTGIPYKEVEKYLKANYPTGNLCGFYANYHVLASSGNVGAVDFERATKELFEKVLGYEADHVGSLPKHPDVYIQSHSNKYCGIIDNKASSSYDLPNDHRNRMAYNYLPMYSHEKYPLRFFIYIAAGFGTNIDKKIQEIKDISSIDGCAVQVDYIIDIAQNYVSKSYSHADLEKIFTVNREVQLADLK